MPAPRLRITPAIAGLLLRDLDRHIEAAVAAGQPRPNVKLAHADGLTREDARELYNWGLRLPGAYKALTDSAHPDHREIAAFRDMADYFQHDHPQRPDGSPASWAEAGQPISQPLAAYLLDARPSVTAAELSPAEARALLDYGEIHGGLAGAEGRPKAAELKSELEALGRRASEAPPPDMTPEERMANSLADPAATARKEVDALFADKDFMAAYTDKRAPGHQEAVERMARLHEVVAGARESAPSGTTARGEINRLFGDKEFMKSYLDKRDPEHGTAVEMMATLHEKAVVDEAASAAAGEPGGAPPAPATGGA